ncbi:FtsK/SpoIIIE domain-containing protein [Cellulomonas sp. NPDC089187]|uniref:FtsK/SpoIIIE domain-containing protein n=1 Tax=Cellulomonas sp. NPDC089187 TaxID=3154970 RepID=UPI0034252F45
MTSLIPLVFAVVMALAFNNPRMLAFGLMSPLMMVANFINSRKQGAVRYREQVAEHTELSERIESDAAQAVVQELTRRLFLYPDAAEVGVIATTPTPRLWERRIGDEHHLALRCGTADQPSGVTLEDPEQLEHKRKVVRDVRDAPAVVHLAQTGVLGVAGADGRASALARWFVAQIGVLHSPRDVQVYVLRAPENRSADATTSTPTVSWDFISWLPHARPLFGQDCMSTVGFGAQSLARRIAELQQLIDLRREAAQQQTAGLEPPIVVVMDGAHRLRAMPGVTRILTEGPRYGIYSICTDENDRLLPEECVTVVDIQDSVQLTIRRHKEDPIPQVLPDWVDDDWLDWVGRALSPMEDASPQVSDAAIPDASRLLDVAGLEPPTPDAIAARWLLNPRSTQAVVGESIDGPFQLDISQDGPHALVAGTTGSGKSELLQTLVASLAISNTPEGMTFVLVDYKGGAAFKDCVDLPPHRRNGHRPRHALGGARPRVVGGRAAVPRACVGRRRGQGPRRLHRPRRQTP